jgi:hypothetical protein
MPVQGNEVIESYTCMIIRHHAPGYPSTYACIELHWDGRRRARLWFYLDGATIPAPQPHNADDGLDDEVYGRFVQGAYQDCVDLLRNEKPVRLVWKAAGGVFLVSGEEAVGEGETP